MPGNTGVGGMLRAHYPPGCLLSRGGTVPPRRNRNLGKSKTGGPGGPPNYLPRRFSPHPHQTFEPLPRLRACVVIRAV
jgi:hypothetical protein